MRLVTRDHLPTRPRRMWPELFGVEAETVELPAETEADRLFAAAVVLADDFRLLPEFGLAQASAEERFLFALATVRVLRSVETGEEP